MEIDKKTFLDSLGGPEAASRMDSEARADALESHMMAQLNRAKTGDPAWDQTKLDKYPTVAEVEAQIETRKYREGVGFMYVPRTGENVRKLPPMPSNPTLYDFFKLRFMDTSNHVLQSANLAMKNGMALDLPEGLVPMTFLVAEVACRIVGRASIRHRLNEFLAREGGHIGYCVLPDHRRRGYANEILRQSLVVAETDQNRGRGPRDPRDRGRGI